ncbi:MAG: InlB B-repeat-containing protein, partial [Prevotellaceae bacterium]|nr:InlB B-repeat-containing protein [Prevotellaceae bacterium]
MKTPSIISSALLLSLMLWLAGAAAAQGYTVTLNPGAGSCTPMSLTEASPGAGVTLPAAAPPEACSTASWIFAGWSAASVSDTDTAPAGLIAAGAYTPAGDITLFAVYKKTEGGGGLEAPIDTIGFESSEGFAASTTYNNTTPKNEGADGKKWSFILGTPSTTDAIDGLQSAQMRGYTTITTTKGSVAMLYDYHKVTKVLFNARYSNCSGSGCTIPINVQYSANSGSTWSNASTWNLTTTKTQYTYTVSSTGEYPNIRIKFEDQLTGTAHRVYIDNVIFYGMVDNPTSTYTSTLPCAPVSTDTYTVTLDAGTGSVTPTSIPEASPGAGVTLPAATPSANCIAEGWTFAGWSGASVSETATAPPLIPAGAFAPTQDTALYAVYNTTAGYAFVAVTHLDSVKAGTYVITFEHDDVSATTYYLPSEPATANIDNPAAGTLTAAGGVLAEPVTESMQWTFTGTNAKATGMTVSHTNGATTWWLSWYEPQGNGAQGVSVRTADDDDDRYYKWYAVANENASYTCDLQFRCTASTSPGRNLAVYPDVAPYNNPTWRSYHNGSSSNDYYKGCLTLYKKTAQPLYHSAPDCTPCTTTPTIGATACDNNVAPTSAEVTNAGISNFADANCNITGYGFVYGATSNPAIGAGTQTAVGTVYPAENAPFGTTLSGLTAGETYYVRAYAINGAGTVYSAECTFTTPAPRYTVTLHAAPGTVPATSLTQDTYGAAVTLPVPALPSSCTGEGWSFAGWSSTAV